MTVKQPTWSDSTRKRQITGGLRRKTNKPEQRRRSKRMREKLVPPRKNKMVAELKASPFQFERNHGEDTCSTTDVVGG